jgi:hypothetical protein
MFQGYAHMVDFFTSFEWWKTEPHDELVSGGNYCLAKQGDTYAIYLPRGGEVTVRIPPGRYRGTWWKAGTGERTALSPITVAGSSWTSPPAPAGRTVTPQPDDWALLLQSAGDGAAHRK